MDERCERVCVEMLPANTKHCYYKGKLTAWSEIEIMIYQMRRKDNNVHRQNLHTQIIKSSVIFCELSYLCLMIVYREGHVTNCLPKALYCIRLNVV